MNNLFICSGIILFYLLSYYICGDLFEKIFPKKKRSFSYKILLGFFIYFLLFQIVALPLKIMLRPLSTLSTLWLIVLGLLLIIWIICTRKSFQSRLQHMKTLPLTQKRMILFLLGLTGIQLILVNLNHETYALWDQSYYVGDISSSVYSNTISQHDPYTGELLKYLNTEYLLETYQNHSAVMCRIFHLAPLLETRTVMSFVAVILHTILYYQIGLVLFQNNTKKNALFMLFLSVIDFFSFNLYTSAEFLFFRGYEGKTILASIILPTVLLLFLRIALIRENTKTDWIDLFFLILASFGINMSGIFMIPFLAGICFVPLALKKHSFSIFLRFCVCMLPCLLYAVAYLLTKHYLFIYTS